MNDRIALSNAREAKIYALRGDAYRTYLINESIGRLGYNTKGELETEYMLWKWLNDKGSIVIVDENFGFCIRLRGNLKLSIGRNRIINLADGDLSSIISFKPPSGAFNSRVEGYHELLKLMNEKDDINYSEFIKNNKHI